MMERIPNDRDWWGGVPEGLDEKCAYDHFFGKSLAEAHELFVMNALYYEEDLLYMPEKPFVYYVRAFIFYLESEKSRGDSDAANCFLGLVDHYLEMDPLWLKSSWGKIRPLLDKIAIEQVAFYDACPDIYGDFQRKVERMLAKRSKQVELLD